MRSIWKGSLSFGLVNVPIKLYSATEGHDLPLHQVHDKDGGRIRYKRVCELDGEEVAYEHIDRAYDDGGRTVVLTQDDLDSLPVEKRRDIDVLEFVPSEQVDPIRFDRSYFLAPDGRSSKAYVLLRQTLESTDRTAIVQVSLRQKTRLAALRVHDDVLLLQTLLWDDEVREARFPELDESVRVSPKELQMSKQLVESFSGDFDPSAYTDEYQEQLRVLVETKLEKGEAIDAEAAFGEAEETGGEVLDLMEALRRSVDEKRAARGGAGASTTTAAPKKPTGKASSGSRSSASKGRATASKGRAKPKSKAS